MTPADLLAQHARPLFPYVEHFVYVRCVSPSVLGGTEPGELIQFFGYPAIVTERVRSGMRAVPDKYTCHAWLPADMAVEEIAAGRFAAVPVQPKLPPRVDNEDAEAEADAESND